MTRLPSLNALRTFQVAAEHLNFTRAARQLCVTQTAVSHQIRLVEETLGFLLFERKGNTLALTRKGEFYYGSVSKAFGLIEQATEAVVDGSTPVALTIGAMPSFAMRWLIPRLPDFRRQCPGIDISVRLLPKVDLSDFMRESVDAAIHTGAVPSDFDQVKLVSMTVFPVCSPALLASGPPLLQPADLRHHALLRVSTAIVDEWALWLDAAGVRGISPARGYAFDSYSYAWQAAIDGVGVAIGRMPLVKEDVETARLVKLFDLTIETDRAWHLVSPRNRRQQRALSVFRDWIVAAAGETEQVRAAHGASVAPQAPGRAGPRPRPAAPRQRRGVA